MGQLNIGPASADMTGPLLPVGYAWALLRSGHSSLPQQNRPGSVGDADDAALDRTAFGGSVKRGRAGSGYPSDSISRAHWRPFAETFKADQIGL
jgi:hypothetical protein